MSVMESLFEMGLTDRRFDHLLTFDEMLARFRSKQRALIAQAGYSMPSEFKPGDKVAYQIERLAGKGTIFTLKERLPDLRTVSTSPFWYTEEGYCIFETYMRKAGTDGESEAAR